MKIEVESKIRLQIGDITAEITHEEARELMVQLSQVLRLSWEYQPPVPVPWVTPVGPGAWGSVDHPDASIKQKVWVYPRS